MSNYPKTITACDLKAGDEFLHPAGNRVTVKAAKEILVKSEFNERYEMEVLGEDGIEYRFATYAQFTEGT